jgi:hypothetical protein
VDNDPPEIIANISPQPNTAGWNNSDVTVSFECYDDKSGIQLCPGPVIVDTEGAGQVITGTAVDNAGNSASASVTLNIDKTPPTITASVERPPDAGDWYTDDVTVSFECADTLSGIDICPEPILVDTDGGGQVISGTAVDIAGNTASASVTINFDKSPPTIIAHITPPPNAAGWNNTDVTVSFECADEGSGIASCSVPVVVTEEGADQAVTGTATDLAGHSNTVTVLISLDKTPPNLAITTQADAPALEIAYTNNFAVVRQGSTLINVYRPIPGEGFYSLGDYVENREGHYDPHGVSAVVKELIPGSVAMPIGYELAIPAIFPSFPITFPLTYFPYITWKPIPPEGYRCLGMIVMPPNVEPNLDEIRCVKEELTTQATILTDSPITKVSGDNGYGDFWEILPEDDTGLYLGSFNVSFCASNSPLCFLGPIVARANSFVIREDAVKMDSWVIEDASEVNGVASDSLSGVDTVTCNSNPVLLSDSTFSCDVTLQTGQNNIEVSAIDLAGNTMTSTEVITYAHEALDVAYTTDFEFVWDDKGSGGSYGVTHFRPLPPEGYYALGHYGQRDYDIVSGISLVAKELVPGALAEPVGFKMVWHDAGSGADLDLGVWKAIPPPGYRCLGLVTVPHFGPITVNDLDDFRCVRKELVAPGRVASRIWLDQKTGSYFDFGSWQISPADENGLFTGAFTGRSYPSDVGYAKPFLPEFVLDARSVAGSVELSEAEISVMIDTYAPVLAFHPLEEYLPDDPEFILDHAELCWALVRNENTKDSHSKEELDCMETSADGLMADVAYIENNIKPNPPYSNDPDFRIWLQIPEELKHGNLERSKPLVHVRPLGAFTEIQFWYFYPFNGHGWAVVNSNAFPLPLPVTFLKGGRHWGDWEMVSILVDNRTQEMIAAALSQHGDIQWVQYNELEKFGETRPVIYAALNTHANYYKPGDVHYEVLFHVDEVGFWFLGKTWDMTFSGGQQLSTVTGNYHLAVEEPDLLPTWLEFPYRWGQYILNDDEIYIPIPFYGTYTLELWDEVGVGPTGPPQKHEW